MIRNVQLPKSVVPISYNLKLHPDFKNFTFSGMEIITLRLLKSTKEITLHSKELEIATVHYLAGAEKIFGKISYNNKSETATFSFSQFIQPGKIKLNLVFKGILNDKMCGFYKSSYNLDNQTHHLATTQFEATDARRAFPCFDEPAQKSIFHVSLVIPKGKTAISNTLPISVLEHEAGFEVVKFSPTPKMSTYLLAFIVGDFEYLEKKSKRGIVVRVYTTPGKKHQAKFALHCTVKTLEFYEKYFAIPYPLQTLDLIAIPDFAAGAMENWGAITYRENTLLVDPEHSSTSTRQWVALVIAHELAHQWFGNLVTMEWWTHLWLNEGFASYIEYLAVDKLFPKWDIWTQFSTNDLGVALKLDALKTTHPIEIPVHHPDEIGEIFDAVSYSKGASIIRMLASYLGERNFRDGLRYYLKKHSYKNTKTVHLWQAFEKISKKPVAKMMHTWTSKPGYPVIKAEIKNGKINLSQSRFFSSPLSKARTKDKTKWQIPIIFGENKVNLGETGFFRTAYSRELLVKLREPIQKKKLSARDRLGIIRDLFALAEAGTIPTTNALEFLTSYKKEDNYTVWLELISGLSQLEQLLAKTADVQKLHQLIITLLTPTHKRLGWNNKDANSHTDSLLRSLVISRLGKSGDKRVIVEARKKFKALLHSKHVSPDIRGAIYNIVANAGGRKEYGALIKKYRKETLHEERSRIGAALGNFKSKNILKRACNFALSKHVRIQDAVEILSSVGGNPLGRDTWLEALEKNWKTLVYRYGSGGFILSRMIKGISSSPEARHLKSFKKFFAGHVAPGAKRAVEQVLERLESNIAWLKRDQGKIHKFLTKL